tara:strand:- start:301 stop:624 length:324 start_codon:yes stop_codon:yes gene_type:complete
MKNTANTKFQSLTADAQMEVLASIGKAAGEKARNFCYISDETIDRAVRNARVYALRSPRWRSVMQVSYSSARTIASEITSDIAYSVISEADKLQIEFAGFAALQVAA